MATAAFIAIAICTFRSSEARIIRPQRRRTHDHSTFEYLRISVVGALFALSPPLSMMAFIAVVLAEATPGSVVAVLGVYGVAIVLTMATVGGGIGYLFSFVRERDRRIHALAQLSASVLVVLYGCYFLWQAVS